VVYLEASIEQQLERTRRDKRRPLLQNTDDPEKTLIELQQERDPLYREIADYVVATNENTVKSVANKIAELVTENPMG
jgi:shikimate kinase